MKRARIVRPLLVSFTLLLGAVALTGCATKPGVAAEVDGKAITESRIESVTSELAQYYRDGGIEYTPVRLQAVDALVLQHVVEWQKDANQKPVADIDVKQVRAQMKQEFETGCQEGKARLEAADQDPNQKASQERDKFEQQLNKMCAMVTGVDNLSDDAIVVHGVDRLKQAQGIAILYPNLKNDLADVDIYVAPRYGTFTENALKHHAPSTVFFLPRQ